MDAPAGPRMRKEGVETKRQPDARDIRELVAFLPRLYGDERRPVAEWVRGRKAKEGALVIPWPKYNEDVEAFFHLLCKECWIDYEYVPEEAGRLLEDEAAVKKATIQEIQMMFTFVLRGERFCDGFWEGMIKDGHIRRLLERLKEIERQGISGGS